jgi:molecular chaperone DnaK
MAADNLKLGEFNLGGIAPAPRGVPKIDVSFDIDANGILNVAARDTVTGKSASITISGSTRLPQGDKERMIREAERYAEDDRQRRAAADRLNEADSTAYQAEKMLAEHALKLTDEVKKRLEEGIRAVREALAKKDPALAAERSEALKQTLKEAGTILYAQTAEAYQAQATPPPQGSGSRVVDAEYREAGPR